MPQHFSQVFLKQRFIYGNLERGFQVINMEVAAKEVKKVKEKLIDALNLELEEVRGRRRGL